VTQIIARVLEWERSIPSLLDAEIVGQLESFFVAGQAHKDVDRLFADRHASPVFEAEGLVELNGTVDIGDAVTGV
jgi:hypothetical protein